MSERDCTRDGENQNERKTKTKQLRENMCASEKKMKISEGENSHAKLLGRGMKTADDRPRRYQNKNSGRTNVLKVTSRSREETNISAKRRRRKFRNKNANSTGYYFRNREKHKAMKKKFLISSPAPGSDALSAPCEILFL